MAGNRAHILPSNHLMQFVGFQLGHRWTSATITITIISPACPHRLLSCAAHSIIAEWPYISLVLSEWGVPPPHTGPPLTAAHTHHQSEDNLFKFHALSTLKRFCRTRTKA